MLAPGTYYLDGSYLRITAEGVSIRGVSGDRGSVVLDGGYVTNEIIQITASNVTIADLTLMQARHHPIHVSPAESGDVLNTLIYNVHIIDPGQQAIKINPNASRTYFPDQGEIACSRLELTDSGRSAVWAINDEICYTGGVDAHQARGWTVRDNEIEGFWCRNGLSEHGIHFWRGCRDTDVRRNRLVDNVRGIGFGLVSYSPDVRTYPDNPCPGVSGYVGHYGGLVMNNFVLQTREELRLSEYGFDTGIALAQSCGARVVHNSVVATSTPFNSIEYRFANTSAEITNNLVSHDIISREGGAAILSGNVDGAALNNFVAPYAGDLHLAGSAAVALNTGVDPGLGEYGDMDGQQRMQPPDVGADERNPGDINGDGAIDLTDTILGLRILGGFATIPTYPRADITDGGRLSMADVLFTLQVTAGLRSP